ncbi:MAG: UDP-N-acetylenolpyruvoylglucosamine reductase, partial [Pseudomonadales bacterium]|nr:UDP-N-acetylenolpyruvoylglucosamine reductase [Pseudomonadales bacterium]
DEVKARDLRHRFPGLVAYSQAGGYKLAAGWLIDYAGLRGQGNQHVGCHAEQALVLVNRGGASASDVLAWARHVQARVQDVFGIVLEIEPRIY